MNVEHNLLGPMQHTDTQLVLLKQSNNHVSLQTSEGLFQTT
jgi:hypothetical protein